MPQERPAALQMHKQHERTDVHKRNEEGRLDAKRMGLAREKAERILNDPAFARISTASFTKYDRKKIQEHEAMVDAFRQRKHLDAAAPLDTQEGVIGEGFIMDMVGNARWFGEASIRRTTEHDDFFNHVDAILALRHGATEMKSTTHVALGIDATTSKLSSAEKIHRIAEHVRKGTLGTIEYAEIDNFRGELTHVSESVLYIGRESFNDVMARWTIPDARRAQSRAGAGEDSLSMEKFAELGSHPLQLEFLVQMYLQLQAYSKLTNGRNRERLKNDSQVVFQKLLERCHALGTNQSDLALIMESDSVSAIKATLADLDPKKFLSTAR